MRRLTELAAICSDSVVLHGEDVAVDAMTDDSRQVKVGALFAAVAGVNADGAKYIPGAVSSGAVALLAQQAHDGIPTLVSDNIRRSVAQIAAALYVPQPQHIMAVTGTNGKTSVADFYRQLWTLQGEKAASAGTLGLLGVSDETSMKFPAVNTSPGPVVLAQMLQAVSEEHIHHMAVEASSHGLHQYRLDGVHISSAVFTNLTQDHLDYHGTMERYFEAKSRLFSALNPKHCIVNMDDEYGKRLANMCAKQTLVSYGFEGNDCRLLDIKPVAQGLAVEMQFYGENFSGLIPLYGAFQIHNIAAALCAAVCEGMSPHDALSHIDKLQGVSGRMEKVATHKNGAPLFIDYAHTPDALEQVLKSVRAHCDGALHVVFGCGGDRDKTKRPIMGSVAEKLADNIIITDDNPRSEDAAGIRSDIMSGIKEKKVTHIPCRREAIYTAVQHLSAGDVLVVAGKGHEAYQIIGDQTFEFNDKTELSGAARYYE